MLLTPSPTLGQYKHTLNVESHSRSVQTMPLMPSSIPIDFLCTQVRPINYAFIVMTVTLQMYPFAYIYRFALP